MKTKTIFPHHRTLVFCGDRWHPPETVQHGLTEAGGEGFDFHFTSGSASSLADDIKGFQLVILAKANMLSASNEREWLTVSSQDVLVDFVREGGGLVAIHSGCSRYEHLAEINTLMGGAFQHHPAPCKLTLEPAARHPLTMGLAPFEVQDEHYFVKMNRPDVDVFVHSRSEHGIQPAAWRRIEHRGRVGVLTPGHHPDVWLHPGFQTLLLNVLNWARGHDQ